MNFKVLKYVVTVAEEKSFTRAAKRLAISQPSLSQNIQGLEVALGVSLFDRKCMPLTLTYAGKLYVEWAKQILLSESQVERRISTISKDQSLRLVVGIAPHRSPLMLPKIIGNLAAEFPDCSIVIEDGLIEEALYEKVYNHEIDLLVGDTQPDTIRFKNIPVTEERILLAVPSSYKINGFDTINEKDSNPRIHLDQLRDWPFITLGIKTYLGAALRRLCEQEEFLPINKIECNSVATAHLLVSRGIGITIIPELFIRLSPPLLNIDYFIIERSDPHRTMSIIYRNGDDLMNPAKRFIELFMEMYHKKSPERPIS